MGKMTKLGGIVALLFGMLITTSAAAEKIASMADVMKPFREIHGLHNKPALQKEVIDFLKAGTDAEQKQKAEAFMAQLATVHQNGNSWVISVAQGAGFGPDLLAMLIAKLGEPDERSLANRYLPWFKQGGYEALSSALKSTDTAVQQGAAQATEFVTLAKIRRWNRIEESEMLVMALIPLLTSKDSTTANAACNSLKTFYTGKDGQKEAIMPVLKDALKTKELSLKRNLFRLLAAKKLAPVYAEELQEAASKTEHELVFIAAANAVTGASANQAPCIGPLSTALHDTKLSRRSRLTALTALSRIYSAQQKVEENKPDLSGLVKDIAVTFGDSDDVLALAAAKALAGMGTSAIAELAVVLEKGTAQAQRFACYTVSRMGKNAAELAPMVEKLTVAKDALVRRNAIEALAILKGAEAKSQLIAALGAPDIRVSETAADLIQQYLPADKDALAALKKHEASLAKKNVAKADPDDTAKYPADRYVFGGPMAGISLPLFPPQHGEVPGAPGTIAELAKKAAEENKAGVAAGTAKPAEVTNKEYTPVGQSPQVQLYKGSVEHFRNYWMKYCPVRSFFDEQSQVKNWVAGKISGPKARLEKYEEPIYWTPRWGHNRPTGYKRAPVAVQRYGKQDKPFKLDCGVLQEGVYTIRIIAAVPTEHLQWFRKSLVVRLKINDGVGGSTHEYAVRCNYTDEFYAMSEISFNTPEKRAYSAELWLDPESEVELLIHNISLDDAMTGVTRRAVKTKMTSHTMKQTGMNVDPATVPERQRKRRLLAEERDMRDRWLWRCFPPAAAQKGNGGYRPPAQVITQPGPRPEGSRAGPIGSWSGLMPFHRGQFKATPADPDVWMVNNTLGLTYTTTDLQAGNPLPDPYPYKDRGYGIVWQDAKEPGKQGRSFAVIGGVVHSYHWSYSDAYIGSCDNWTKTGNADSAHDAAVALARWAYAFPVMTTTENIYWNNLADVGACSQQQRFHKRMSKSHFYSWYTKYATTEIAAYDRLYPFIENNWQVARAVGQFVPWVKTPKDVIKLIDTHLVQMTAKKILRYHWYTGEMKIATLASVLGENKLTDPWMEWLFNATTVYPFPVAGLTDLMVSGCTREGTEYVASTAYARGENALPKATALVSYLKAGGNPKYDLSDSARYPKPLSTCYWLFDSNVAGLNFVRTGDVTGPDKHIGQGWKTLPTGAYWGWKWSKDPYFAHAMVNYFPDELKKFSDEEQAKIKKAAEPIRRPLWLDLKSRIMPQWASVLETGLEHDDYRFRRSVAIRTGMGWGHHHNDGLDLQVYAHGTMMTIDGGQRPTYSRPADRSTRMHDLVEVDKSEWLVHTWTAALSDGKNAKYVRNTAIPPKGFEYVDLYSRQTALMDVDEGEGSEKLDIKRMGLKPAGLKADAKTANSYVFDVFRVAGGNIHTYAFHGNLCEKVTQNVEAATAFDKLPEDEKAYIGRMAGDRLGGDAPEHLTVDFHLQEKQVKADLPNDTHANYRPHVTRLHLVGHKGARVLRASLNCTQWGYQIPMVFVQNCADDAEKKDMQTAFAAVIEPYVESPFIQSAKRLTIDGNDTDASKAVALSVATVNGHTDLCFADGRPEKTRTVEGTTLSGEFAYLSRDKDGVRQASLTGGTKLSADDISIATAAREYSGTVADVDYSTKTMTLDKAWPAASFLPAIIEVGTENHWTAYNIKAFAAKGGKTAITVKGGADYYLSRVKEVDEKANTVVCALGFGSGTEGNPSPGIDKHWVASNEERTKFWRAEFQGGNIGLARFTFKLTGPKVTMADFGRSKAFRLWEYGPGDTVRHSTFVSVSRKEAGVYLVETDVDCSIGLQGANVSLSADGKTWKPAKTTKNGALTVIAITQKDLRDGRAYLKIGG